MDCVTPSHPDKIPHGESLTMNQLLDKGPSAFLDPSIVPQVPIDLDLYTYAPRTPVMSETGGSQDLDFLRAQVISSDQELTTLIRDVTKKVTDTKTEVGSKAIRKPRSVRKILVPNHAQPQSPRLVEAPYVREPNWLWKQPLSSRRGPGLKEWTKTPAIRASHNFSP